VEGTGLKERLRRGEVVLGCFQRIPAPEVTEVCAYAGFDFVVVDTEHTLVSEERVADLVRAAEAAGIAPLVRASSHDPAGIARLLEAGPVGLHVPQVSSAAEAAAAVRATRFQPRGSRGLATPRRAGYGARMTLEEYVRTSEEELVLVLQVEDAAGLAELASIASLDGVDAVFLGLTDLSQNLGVPGRYDDPTLVEAVERAFETIRRAGKPVGVPVVDADMARRWLDRGATYLAANDIRLLLGSAREFLARAREQA